MDDFAKKFQKKFNGILKAEGIKPAQMSKIVGLSSAITFDYGHGRSGPSAKNLLKIIQKFPKYTGYLLDLDLNKLPQQTTPKD